MWVAVTWVQGSESGENALGNLRSRHGGRPAVAKVDHRDAAARVSAVSPRGLNDVGTMRSPSARTGVGYQSEDLEG